MPLREEFEQQGTWLFRWRSFLPLLLLPFVFFLFPVTVRFEERFGTFITGIYETGCIIISFAGMFIRILTVGYIHKDTSGSNTQTQKAHTVNTTGLYSIVRHPLYLGNFVIALGFALFFRVWWFAVIFILAFWLYYERIMFREEEFLRSKFGDLYTQWASKTPSFIPNPRLWKKPDLGFSFKKVIHRDYIGLFEIIALFTILELLKNYIIFDSLYLQTGWIVFFLCGLVFFIIVRILKKKTRVLDYEEK